MAVHQNVFYVMQGDEGEEMSHPNLFRIRQKGNLLHRQILDHFPLANTGSFHFRYRRSGKKRGSYVWVDVTRESSVAPKFNGNYFMQVLRLERLKLDYGDTDVDQEENLHKELPDGYEYDNGYINGPIEDDEVEYEAKSARRSSNLRRHNSSKLLADFVSSPADARPRPAEDIDDDNDDAEEKDGSDTQGMASLETLIGAFEGMLPGDEDGEGDDGTNASNVISNIHNNLQSALDTKEKISDEESRLKARIHAWSTDNGGHLKNVRTLFSTLHTVLYKRGLRKWKEVGMADVLTAKDVERHFRKAMRVLHTDRLPKDATAEEVATATLLYDPLQKAMKLFREKESGK